MKPFNLEEAKNGKPVCTRDGKKARIICFDRKKPDYPIIALVKEDKSEDVHTYKEDGGECLVIDYDLMMVGEKKEGWINLYRTDALEIITGNRIFETKDMAKQCNNMICGDYLDTIKIEYEL